MQLRILSLLILSALSLLSPGQERSLRLFLADSSMLNASVSLCVINSQSGETVFAYDSRRSLAPASTMKLITTAAALEILGPGYTFRTSVGYSGTLNDRTGKLEGDIIIKGGGDPALGSSYFSEHYGNFINNWIDGIIKTGIKRIDGRIIADDSRYDYQPAPAKWLWEDLGNYYGAGAYGLSFCDNTCRLHFTTSDSGSVPVISKIDPSYYSYAFSSRLIAAGDADRGYIFSAPYGGTGWIEGSIPVNRNEFVLKGSIADPPLLMAEIIHHKLDSAGIIILEEPTTRRLMRGSLPPESTLISEVISPPLDRIIEILNHESVNLYAEHLIKEIGLVKLNSGSTASGIKATREFLERAGVDLNGMFIEDGSGLSSLNSITSEGMTRLLYFMKMRSSYAEAFLNSLPDAGKEGTLKNYFNDPAFDMKMKAKSGSITRVRAYAGYLNTLAGNELIFCIIINNYSGASRAIINCIEQLLKEVILNK